MDPHTPSCFKLYSSVFSLPLKLLTLHSQARLAPKSFRLKLLPFELLQIFHFGFFFFLNEYLLSVYCVPGTVLSISNCIS